MKKILTAFGLLFLALPTWADDDLKPEPLDQAVQEYNGFWRTETPDPMNHEVWKLYIYYDLKPREGAYRVRETLVAGLTSKPKDHYFVFLKINQLYNFLRPIPKRGDVIVVEGRIKDHTSAHISGKRDYVLNILHMDAQNAMALPNEHFEFTTAATTDSLETMPSPSVPSATAIPTVLGQQGASVR